MITTKKSIHSIYTNVNSSKCFIEIQIFIWRQRKHINSKYSKAFFNLSDYFGANPSPTKLLKIFSTLWCRFLQIFLMICKSLHQEAWSLSEPDQTRRFLRFFSQPSQPCLSFTIKTDSWDRVIFQTAIEKNWSEGRIEKNDDLLFSQQSRHSRPSSLCEASSSCFFSATPSAIKTGQNCSKIVDTYVFMDRENLSKLLWEY